MNRLIVAACTLCAACSQPLQIENADLAIANANVIDVEDGTVLGERTIVINDGKITTVATAEHIVLSKDIPVHDAAGQYMVPGYTDMHAHLFHPSQGPLLISNGVLYVRDMGTDMTGLNPAGNGTFGLRARAANGDLRLPLTESAGYILNGGFPDWYTHAPFFRSYEDPSEAVATVTALSEGGAHFVKLYDSLSPEVFAAIADQAQAVDLPISGHVARAVGLRTSIHQGQTGLEHFRDLLVSISVNEDAHRAVFRARRLEGPGAMFEYEQSILGQLLDEVSEEKFQAMVALFKEHGVYFTPTLVLADDSGAPDLSQFAGIIDSLDFVTRAMIQPRRRTEKARAIQVRYREWLLATTARLHAAGLPLYVGTDFPNPSILPGFAYHREMGLMVQAGLSAADVLRSATIGAAERLGRGDTSGSIAVGKDAQLLLLQHNPLMDIGNSNTITAIIRGDSILLPEQFGIDDAR